MSEIERSKAAFREGKVYPSAIYSHPNVDSESFHRFLGGTSGCNGTLCIRGSRQDYDKWDLKGWSGEEMYRYMSKVP